MKHFIQIAAIIAGVVAIFAAAELMPVMLSQASDKKTIGQITTQEEQEMTAGIAYELSYADKLTMLGDEAEHTCTRIYHTDSLLALKQYDNSVMDTLWDAIDTYNQIAHSSRLLEGTEEKINNENDPVYIRLNRTDDAQAEQLFDEASCISVRQKENAGGAMTLWLLTFREKENIWQFLLDTTEKRLYALWEYDTEKDWSGFSILAKHEKGVQETVERQLKEICKSQMALYYGSDTMFGGEKKAIDGFEIQITTETDRNEVDIPAVTICQLLNLKEEKGINLGCRIGSDAFYDGIAVAAGEYKLSGQYSASYFENYGSVEQSFEE